ncbi:MAG: HD domain-containing phosphohydrolase [Candidatus Baltobacteraceae bacterium]
MKARKMTVLMVDDNELNLKVYKRALADLRTATCVPFSLPQDALEWSKVNEADAVIVDYDMPALNGLEFIEAFRQMPRNKDVPIVMVTAIEARHIRYQALGLGAADFLTKPVDIIDFRARVQNMLTLVSAQKKLADRAYSLTAEVESATARIVAREKETIYRLTRAAEFRDNETGMHIVRMAHFSAEIGRALGLSNSECDFLLMATPMHDIGKVAIPDRILLKPAKLDAAEWAIMKQHTIIGHEILKGSESDLLQMAAEIALSHHEKFDGTGYPFGLASTKIAVSGRICAVSDVFDALTSNRPYKTAWPTHRAVAEIDAGSGSHFDPEIVRAFHQALPKILAFKTAHEDAAA